MELGQDLDLLVKRISYDDLGTIIGSDMVETIPSLDLPRAQVEVFSGFGSEFFLYAPRGITWPSGSSGNNIWGEGFRQAGRTGRPTWIEE